MKKELIHFLSQYITDKRYETFNRVINNRTRYLTVILENLFQPHNTSAVLRTCDCFGIQDIHIIENEYKYQVNIDISVGSEKWINLHRYNQPNNNTLQAINHLKKNGYRIVATTPHHNDVDLPDFDLTKGKAAFIFGAELPGLSKIALENADEYLKIPMYGFTESFNISVSASLILYQLTSLLRKTDINWQLSQDEKEDIMINWLKKTVKTPDLYLKRFNQKFNTHFC